MKKSMSAIVFAIVFGVALSTVVSLAQEGRRPLLGGYREVATDDSEVQAAAEFAVNAQGEKQSSSIKLTSVDRAERQSAAGSNFKLCLTVEIAGENDEDNVTQQVKVVVHRNLKQEHSLKSWEEGECEN